MADQNTDEFFFLRKLCEATLKLLFGFIIKYKPEPLSCQAKLTGYRLELYIECTSVCSQSF